MDAVPVINHTRCTRCGRCIYICPKDVLVLEDDKIKVTVDECMLCSHCYDICPVDAVSFHEEHLRGPELKSFTYTERMIQPGEADAGDLVNLMRSRRSIRIFKETPLPDEVLSDLVEIAVTAPSGSNCQNWEFTVVQGREKVWNFALAIKNFFVRLNRLAKNPVIRYLSIPFAGRSLLDYYNEHMESVEMALEDSERGIDRLFHGAPSLVIIHSSGEESTPVEDACLASLNLSLAAHAMGAGTCYIGYAVEAMNRVRSLRGHCSIPAGNRVYVVLALGYPGVRTMRPSLRKPFSINWI